MRLLRTVCRHGAQASGAKTTIHRLYHLCHCWLHHHLPTMTHPRKLGHVGSRGRVGTSARGCIVFITDTISPFGPKQMVHNLAAMLWICAAVRAPR
jgi:hypothetical protein